MRVKVEYIKFTEFNGNLFPEGPRFEVVEIDNMPSDDISKLAEEALSKKISLSKRNFKCMSFTQL